MEGRSCLCCAHAPEPTHRLSGRRFRLGSPTPRVKAFGEGAELPATRGSRSHGWEAPSGIYGGTNSLWEAQHGAVCAVSSYRHPQETKRHAAKTLTPRSAPCRGQKPGVPHIFFTPPIPPAARGDLQPAPKGLFTTPLLQTGNRSTDTRASLASCCPLAEPRWLGAA